MGGNSGVYDISDEANLDFVLQYSKFINKNEVVEKVDGELVRFFDEELQNNQSDKVTLELSNALMYSKGFMNFQLIVPKNEEYAESKVWLSKKFITKQTETNFEITLPKDYIVKLDTPLGAVKITSEKLAQLFRGNVFAKTSEVAQENSNIAPVGVKNLTLSPVRKELAEKIVKAMKEGNTEWLKCWGAGAPRNAITGRRYKGINNVMLSLVAYTKGYKDTRWLTFKQIQDKKWKLKKGSKGTPIELLKFMDKTTNKELDFKKFNELEEAEKQSYWKENVRILYKSYTVFNAENVEGIPAYDVKFVSEEERNENCEKLLNSIDTPIIYGGEEAYYSVVKDEIHLPPKTAFHSLGEFYGTAFHEAGHAQGPKLNLDMTGMFGSEKYALRELEVEFASAMLKQELGLDVSQKEINNNAGYIASWLKMAQQNPNVLISAINVGSKIADRLLEYMPDSGARKKDDLEEAVGLRMIELNNVNPIKPISDILNSNSKLNSGPTNNNIME